MLRVYTEREREKTTKKRGVQSARNFRLIARLVPSNLIPSGTARLVLRFFLPIGIKRGERGRRRSFEGYLRESNYESDEKTSEAIERAILLSPEVFEFGFHFSRGAPEKIGFQANVSSLLLLIEEKS